MITTTFINNNIALFDFAENPYSPDYIRNHPDDFDKWGNKKWVPDYDDD
jgi:hypothetical protein